MSTVISFIVISCIYLASLYFLIKHYEKRQEKKEGDNSRMLTEISDKMEVIAMPRNYIINVVHSDNVIDTTQYADMVMNINDIVKSQSLKGSSIEKQVEKVFMKDINFAIYKTI